MSLVITKYEIDLARRETYRHDQKNIYHLGQKKKIVFGGATRSNIFGGGAIDSTYFYFYLFFDKIFYIFDLFRGAMAIRGVGLAPRPLLLRLWLCPSQNVKTNSTCVVCVCVCLLHM